MTTDKQPAALEKYLTPLAVVLGAIIIALTFAFGGGDRSENLGEETKVNIEDVKTDTSPSVGSPEALVTIAVWFDYQCPFCKRFELETLEQVFDTYVATGKVRIVYKDFQFLGPDSMDAAVFARAVWEAHPDRFHDWYKTVMTAQDEEHGGFGDLDSVAELSRSVSGINVDRVLELVSSKRSEYEKAIAADRAEGQSFGINGTPGAIIGTEVIGGAQPYSVVSAAIEAELAK